MRLRQNRVTERAGVNAARAFLEAQEQVFQEVELANDYGKDAYIDFTENKRILGVCAALQIKAGKSFKRASGYAIPVEGHYQVWRNSSVPVIGVVHDELQGKLYWVNITEYLDQCGDEEPTSIPISRKSELTATSLRFELIPSVRTWRRADALGSALLQLCSADSAVQVAAISDCFALGRADVRVMLAIRNSLRSFRGNAIKQAIAILAHAVPHPDIAVVETNHVPDKVFQELKGDLVWSRDELVTLFTAVPWAEGWDRGSLGQCLYHLLIVDSDAQAKVEAVIPVLAEIDDDAAFAALYLTLFWSDNAREKFESILSDVPSLQGHHLMSELTWDLDEYGVVHY